MKAVVAIPPLRDFYFTKHRFSGLGAESLIEVLKREGIDVRYFNLPISREKGKGIELPDALSHLRPYLVPGETGKISFFTQYHHFGPGFSESARLICSLLPDIVFLSCFAFCYAGQTLNLADEIKKVSPSLSVIAGGPGVSVYPSFFLRSNSIDFMLSGDAEAGIPLFLKAFRKKGIPYTAVPNLSWKEKGSIRHSPVRKKTPERDMIFTWSITSETKDKVYISTSFTRGCMKKCRFCTHWAENEMLTVPLETSISGIEEIRNRTGEKGKEICIIFEDDNLLLVPDYFFTLLTLLKETLYVSSFFVETGIDYTLLTPPLLQKLIHSGLKKVNLSLGSTNKELLASENRSLQLSRYETILSIMDKARIPSITYFICGLRGETREIVARNLAYITKRPTVSGISLFYPVPGLPDFQDMSLFESIDPCLCAGSSAYPWNNSLSTKTLVTAFRLSRYINFLKQGPESSIEEELLAGIKETGELYTIVKEKKKLKIIKVPHMDKELEELFFSYL
ncbi:MAG: radical SAM protein [Spirochaetales bacterium]|nr:radical SAM protein [Spirochaetales bacterium]